MPLYDYKCTSCDFEFEKLLSITRCDEPVSIECPSCYKRTVIKVICSPGICDPVRLGVTKAPADFQKYVLGRIAANHPGNTIERTRSIAREI